MFRSPSHIEISWGQTQAVVHPQSGSDGNLGQVMKQNIQEELLQSQMMRVVNSRESSETGLTRTRKPDARRERVGNRRRGPPGTSSYRFQALVSMNPGEKSTSDAGAKIGEV